MKARTPTLPKSCVTCGELALPYPRRGECHRCAQRSWRLRHLEKERARERRKVAA